MTDVPIRNVGGDSEFSRHGEALRGALRRFVTRHINDISEVDDLVQDTFLRIVRRGHVEELENFQAYAFQTAASVIKDRLRRRKVRDADNHISFEPEAHGGEVPSAEASYLAREALRRTTLTLMELPELTRHVFVLRRIEGLPYKEIGLRLGISVSAANKHMVRAIQHLMTISEAVR